MKLILITILLLSLSGCFRLTGVEHTLYGGITRNYSGGEVFSEVPSGHQEQGGSWFGGTALKTIWGR